MNDVTFVLTDALDERDRSAVLEGLLAYNTEQTRPGGKRELNVIVRDADGRVVAGLLGATNWDWLYVSILWVSDEYRGRGIGAKLMARAEVEARARGCGHAWLDTYSFQARPFYEKLGWRVFGCLEDYPAGHRRFFMTKALDGQ